MTWLRTLALTLATTFTLGAPVASAAQKKGEAKPAAKRAAWPAAKKAKKPTKKKVTNRVGKTRAAAQPAAAKKSSGDPVIDALPGAEGTYFLNRNPFSGDVEVIADTPAAEANIREILEKQPNVRVMTSGIYLPSGYKETKTYGLEITDPVTRDTRSVELSVRVQARVFLN